MDGGKNTGNKYVYLFDVDGTLTEPRKRITKKHEKTLSKWLDYPSVKGQCYIITGSDKEKIKEQLPEKLLNKFAGQFFCLGNQYSEGKKIIYTNEFPEDESLLKDCHDFVRDSKFPERYGNHVEKRIGMINISTCGRNIPADKRNAYVFFDKMENEREEFVKRMKGKYGDKYDFSIGGEISIDISVVGKDKSQVLDYLVEHKQVSPDKIIFFGDKCDEGGNDKPLADAVNDAGGVVFPVSHHSQTFKTIETFSATERLVTQVSNAMKMFMP